MSYEATLLERLSLEKQRANVMEREIDALTDRIKDYQEDAALSREARHALEAENADLRSQLAQEGVTVDADITAV